jgi:A nuclease family of the HNH/ENDO VII superfamily with conserved AHH
MTASTPNNAPPASGPTPVDIAELSAAAGVLAQNDHNVNPRELMNAEIIKEEKARVLYKNGYTQTRGEAVLLANAERKTYNHRRRLSTSIVSATNQPRPSGVCAHHIVALTDEAALRSRRIIFTWGIGINDADNGIFLPAKQVGMSGFPNAAHHSPYHSPEYHFTVFVRIRRGKDEANCRKELRGIKTGLLAGTISL